mgnify:CR=1 FL=1
MSLVTLKEILAPANEKGYAVPAFDTMDFMLTEGIIEASEQTGLPVIMMLPGFAFSRQEADAFLDFNLSRIKKAKTPICYHLDHGASVEECFKAIHAGCSSVMFDGSKLPIEENIEKTRQVVKVAHDCGVSVEAEIGHVAAPEGSVEGSVAKEDLFTKPEDAVRFVEETGIDALAIAFGTVHGVYKGKPNLDFERLAAIKRSVSVPLVMHGGSGLPEEDFKKAVAGGINKINFFTGMSLATIASMRKMIEETDGRCRYINLFDTALNTVIKIAKEQFDIFGTQPM